MAARRPEPAGPESGLTSIVIHSTWRGRAIALVGPAALVALGIYGLVAGSPNPINLGSLLIGLVLLAISLFDYPFETHFGPEGIERRAPLRRELLPWARVQGVARSGAGGVARRGRKGRGALLARVGRRHYLLSDQAESIHEHQALAAAFERWEGAPMLSASAPAESQPPTWLHKRRPSEGLVDRR